MHVLRMIPGDGGFHPGHLLLYCKLQNNELVYRQHTCVDNNFEQSRE